jgi:hypothetical protein
MKILVVVFFMLFLSGCEAQSIKKVGYGKTFESHDVFTPASFKLAKNFLALVSEGCTS